MTIGSGMNKRPIICYYISVTLVEQGFEEHIVKFSSGVVLLRCNTFR
ncbi:LOW QUALITY PROTEIN: hypothetical protein HID58_025082, partial [Brassica napus]